MTGTRSLIILLLVLISHSPLAAAAAKRVSIPHEHRFELRDLWWWGTLVGERNGEAHWLDAKKLTNRRHHLGRIERDEIVWMNTAYQVDSYTPDPADPNRFTITFAKGVLHCRMKKEDLWDVVWEEPDKVDGGGHFRTNGQRWPGGLE